MFLFHLSKIFNDFLIFSWLSNFYQFSMTFQKNLFFQDFQWFSMTMGTLFKRLNGSASLLVCTQKFFCWGLQISCEWHYRWSSFWVILAHATWPRAQLPRQSISLKFSLETKLKPAFDQLSSISGIKVISKINKLINYLISQIFLLL